MNVPTFQLQKLQGNSNSIAKQSPVLVMDEQREKEKMNSVFQIPVMPNPVKLSKLIWS